MVYGSPEILDRNPEVLFCWKSSSPIWGTTEVKKGLFGSAIKTLLSLLIHIPSHEGNWTLQAYINSLQSPSQKVCGSIGLRRHHVTEATRNQTVCVVPSRVDRAKAGLGLGEESRVPLNVVQLNHLSARLYN